MRSKQNFSISTHMLEFLTDVAWDHSAAARVAARLRGMPSQREYVVVVWLPVILGALGYLLISIPVSLYKVDNRVDVLFVLTLFFVAVAIVVLPLLRASRIESTYIDMRVINRLLRVLEISENLLTNDTSVRLRLQLAKEIDSAAAIFQTSYRKMGGLVKSSRRPHKRQARQCATVLRRYVVVAMHGDVSAITNLRSDFARAILRVGSGNWTQVSKLDALVHVERRWFDFIPRTDLKVVLPILATLLLSVIQFVLSGPKT